MDSNKKKFKYELGKYSTIQIITKNILLHQFQPLLLLLFQLFLLIIPNSHIIIIINK